MTNSAIRKRELSGPDEVVRRGATRAAIVGKVGFLVEQLRKAEMGVAAGRILFDQFLPGGDICINTVEPLTFFLLCGGPEHDVARGA
jgi:hypothetical protein